MFPLKVRILKFALPLTLAVTLPMLPLSEPALAVQSARSLVGFETSHSLAAFYAQNIFLKHLLASYGKDQATQLALFKQAEEVLYKFVSGQRYLHKAESFEDFKQLERLYTQRYNSLEDEIATVKQEGPPPYFIISNPENEVEQALQTLSALQQKRFEEFELALGGGGSFWSNLVFSSLPLKHLAMQGLRDPEALRDSLNEISDSQRLVAIQLAHAQFGKLIHTIDTTGSTVAKSSNLRFPNPVWQRFFQLVLDGYFKNLNLQSKLNIISALSDLTKDATEQKIFETMVLNAGPQFQKLFQVYAREEGFSDELKATFKQLEQSTRAVPFRLIKQAIDAQPVSFEWVTIDEKPLGIGTMAQVHRAVIRLPSGEEKQVVVRVLKPDTQTRVLQDTEIMRVVAPTIDNDPILRANNFPLLTPFVKDIEEMAMNEMEVDRTVANQRRAVQRYTRDLQIKADGAEGRLKIRVPGVYEVGEKSIVMVQDFVDGTSFEKFAKQNPAMARATVEEVAKLWLEEAIIGSGFFHTDLHQGNLRVGRDLDNSTQVNLLDYGMTGQLPTEMQSKFIALGMSINSGNADLMARVLWEISSQDKNTINQSQLKDVLQFELNRLKEQGRSSQPLNEWVGLVVNAGMRFPPEFSSLNRGVVLVFRMLQDQSSQLDFAAVMKKLLMKNPGKLRLAIASIPSVSTFEWGKVIWQQAMSNEVQLPLLPGQSSNRNQGPIAPPMRECRDVFAL